MSDFEYDDSQLQRLFAELEPKRRKQALKGAFRKEGNRVRKTAVKNFRQTGINGPKEMEKKIRTVVFKKTAGFRVTIGTKKSLHHGSRRSGWKASFADSSRTRTGKPYDLVIIWAENGTKPRHTHTLACRKGFGAWRKRDRHSTGRMPALRFMEHTLNEVRDSVTDNLRTEIRDNVTRVAKKYGCK